MNRKHFLFPLILSFFLFHTLNAQFSHKRRSYVHLDVGGPGGLGSAGVSRTLFAGKHFTCGAGVSFSVYTGNYDGERMFFPEILPEFSMIWFHGKHHLELGLIPKITPTISAGDGIYRGDGFLVPCYRVGWRLEKPEGKSFLRIGLSPLNFNMYEADFIYWPAWPYIGSGFRF
jgi:hypothetical protein